MRLNNALPKMRHLSYEFASVSTLPMEPRRKVSRRQRNARSRPDSKTELHFVNVIPSSQDEKAETRAIIRANAAYFHWRYNRPPQDEPQPSQLRHGARRLADTQLGFDVVDPFSSYASKLPRDFVSRCITYSKQGCSCYSCAANCFKMFEPSSPPCFLIAPTSEPTCYSSQCHTPQCCTCSLWER